MRPQASISYSLDSSFDDLFEDSFGTSGSLQTDLYSLPSKEQISAWTKIKEGVRQSKACAVEETLKIQNLSSDLTENSLVAGAINLKQKIGNEACNGCAIMPDYLREILKLDKGSENNDLVCGRVSDESGNTYTGQLEEGKPNGFGKMIFAKSGDQYEGYWKNSRPHGPGQFVRADGGEFEGEWIHGKLHLVKEGVACVTDRRGNKYDGSFKNWKKHGYGTFVKTNGEKYSGYYVDDMRNGYGVLTYADGSGFEGVFYNDEPTNQGHSIGRTLDKTDTISTLSVCRNNSMNIPEAKQGGDKETNEEVFSNNNKTKSNRKFLKNLNIFKSSKSKDDDTLGQKTLSSSESPNNDENIAGVMNARSTETKSKKFALTPKKLMKLPNLRTPRKKYRDPATVSDEDYAIHQV